MGTERETHELLEWTPPASARIPRNEPYSSAYLDMKCLDTIARYLLYAFIIDFSLEMLDLIHRIYEVNESFKSLDFIVHTRLYTSQIVLQIGLGTLLPIALLALAQVVKLTEAARRGIYVKLPPP